MSVIKNVTCKPCSLEFGSRPQLTQHMTLKHKVCPYKCTKCKRSFSNKMAHNDHQAIHSITEEAATFPCDKCSVSFVSIQYLNCHIRDVHSENKFTCEICSRDFRALRYLKEHKSKIHSGKEKPKCPICSKEFRGKGELKTHSIIHTGERPYQCLICSKSFRARSNLDVHMKIHNGIKDYVCNVCGRGFIVKNDLKRHLTLHIGSKDFVCQECGKCFNRKYQLEKHSLCVHGKENKNLVKAGSRKDENTQKSSLPDKNDNKQSIETTNSSVLNSDKAMEQCSSIESIQDISNQLVMVLPPHNNNDIIIMRNDIKVISGQNMEESEIDSRLFVLDEQGGTITLSDSKGANTVIFTDQQDTQNLVLTSNCDTATDPQILDSQSSCDENVFLTDNQDSIILAENNVCGNILVEEVIEASDIMNDDGYGECNINNNIPSSSEEVLTADGNMISLKESDESLDALGEGSDILLGCQAGKDPVLSDAEGGKLNLTDDGGEDDLVLVDGCEDESDDGEGSLTLSSQHSSDQIYDYANII